MLSRADEGPFGRAGLPLEWRRLSTEFFRRTGAPDAAAPDAAGWRA